MGYTHYYQIKGAKSKEWKAAWPKLIRDAQKIVDAESQHVQLADADGEEYGSEDEDFPPPVIKEKEGIELNGVSSSAHEPLILTLDDEWKFCKTEEKPYDVAVGCILLRAYTLVPEKFELSSDGHWDDEWKPARALYHRLWPDEELECPREMREEEREAGEESEGEESEESQEDEEYKP